MNATRHVPYEVEELVGRVRVTAHGASAHMGVEALGGQRCGVLDVGPVRRERGRRVEEAILRVIRHPHELDGWCRWLRALRACGRGVRVAGGERAAERAQVVERLKLAPVNRRRPQIKKSSRADYRADGNGDTTSRACHGEVRKKEQSNKETRN